MLPALQFPGDGGQQLAASARVMGSVVTLAYIGIGTFGSEKRTAAPTLGAAATRL